MEIWSVKKLIDKFDLNLNVPGFVLYKKCENYRKYSVYHYPNKTRYTFFDEEEDSTFVLYVYDEFHEYSEMDEVYEWIIEYEDEISSTAYNIYDEEIPSRIF